MIRLDELVTSLLAEPSDLFDADDLARIWQNRVPITERRVQDVLEDTLRGELRLPEAPLSLASGRWSFPRCAPALKAALRWGLVGAWLEAGGYLRLSPDVLTEVLPRLFDAEQCWFSHTSAGLQVHLHLCDELGRADDLSRLHAALPPSARAGVAAMDLAELVQACRRRQPLTEPWPGCTLTFTEPLGNVPEIGLWWGETGADPEFAVLELFAQEVAGLAACEGLAFHALRSQPTESQRFPWLTVRWSGPGPAHPFLVDLTPPGLPALRGAPPEVGMPAAPDGTLLRRATDLVLRIKRLVGDRISPWLTDPGSECQTLRLELTAAAERLAGGSSLPPGPAWQLALAGAERIRTGVRPDPFRLHRTTAPDQCWLVAADAELGALFQAIRRGLL